MAIRCPYCGEEFDVTLFEFDRTVKCVCGNIVTMQHRNLIQDTSIAREIEEAKICEIKRAADKIAFLIVSTDYPKIDIEIEKEKFRERINRLFPDKGHLYDLIYEPRFKRLEEQFRNV
jgi:hypothetical protein